MKTLLGTDIPESTRGILYLCKFNPHMLTIKVKAEVFFDSAWQALDAYANIPNPESQLVTGIDYSTVCTELETLHKDMQSKEWLKNLAECL